VALSSRHVFDMQWCLQRVVAMRGRAERDFDDDDTDGDSGLHGSLYDTQAILTWLAEGATSESGLR